MKADERWSPLLPAEDPEKHRDYTARIKVYRYKGAAGWHLANLPLRQSAQIKARFGATARGWGSIRVRIRIGGTEWATSLFPDRRSKTYLFAIKAAVRSAEGLAHGDTVTAHIHVV
jgi:hypothetical protein